MEIDREFRRARRAGRWAIAAAMGFVVVVVALHLAQRDYDPARQLMSELALGRYGWAMLPAFACLGAAPLALAWGMGRLHRAPGLRGALTLAGLSFLGAGLLPLGRSSDGHIAFVALAFVAVVLAMYLLPAAMPDRFGGPGRLVSWGLAGSTAASVLLGQSLLPMGVAQRLAAACVVAWFCLVGAKLGR